MKATMVLAACLAMLLPALAGAQVEELGFTVDGVERSSLVFVPAGAADGAAMPVVLALHGAGMAGREHMDITGMNAVADTAGFIAVYPDAVGTIWNSGIGDSPDWATRTPDVDDVGFLAALLDTLAARYRIDAERVYACGMSNGAMMAYRLACDLPERIAAVASVAGTIADGTAAACGARHPTPVLMIHGTDDVNCPFDDPGVEGWLTGLQARDFWLDWNGCGAPATRTLADLDPSDGSTVEQATYACDAGSPLEFYRVEGGPHNWPGNPLDLRDRFPTVGIPNRDIDASVEIWRFFREVSLRGVGTAVEATTTESLPHEPYLEPSYPNPFNGATAIRFAVPWAGQVRLTVHDVTGATVATPVDGRLGAGAHRIRWEAGDLPSGAYFLRLRAGGVEQTRKVLLIR